MRKSLIKGCLSLGLLGGFGIIIIFLLLIGIGSFLSVGDRVKPVDAIVVLSGDEGERIKEASDWYLRGYGKFLIITKTDNEEIGEQKTYSEKMMRIAMDAGVPQDSIIFTDDIASNTIEEARAVLLTTKIRNINSILVITDPYHTRRANAIFDTIFQGQEIDTYIHGVRNSWYSPMTWFFQIAGWRQTITELGGLFVFLNQRNN